MVKRYFVATRLLKVGMKIDQSIIDGTSRVLIARGAILDEYMIDGLRKLGISGVYIREGEEDTVASTEDANVAPATLEKIEKLKVPDRARVNISDVVRERVAEGISYLYSNSNASEFADTTRDITNDLMKAIEENDAVAIDINMLKISDEYTFKHSVDVATISMIIAKKLGLSHDDVYDIGITGLLHDIGKSKIPNEILNKPGRLTDEEFDIMKQHSVYGYRILQDKADVKETIKLGVLQHHEKSNGKGYPMGVGAAQISQFAKIISVADIYDALVTERPYKQGFSPRDAVEMLMAMTGELDISSLRAFMGSVILYPVGSTVDLSNGERARVVENYEEAIMRPKVVGLTTGKIYDLATDITCTSIIIM